MTRRPTYESEAHYAVRALGSVATALLLLIAAVHLWPATKVEDDEEIVYRTRGQETIEIESITQTTQDVRKPPPPAPIPPVVVPDDQVIDDAEVELFEEFEIVEAPPGEEQMTATASEGDRTVMEEARPVRIVEPEYTRAARRKNVRAEVVVEVLVNERGRVEDTRVVERFVIGKEDEEKTAVRNLGYGLERAAQEAARQWMFRPARLDGKAIRSYKQLTFSFGV